MRKRTYEGESGSDSDSDSTKTDVVAALENDLNIFEKESKIPVDLDWHVYSSPDTQHQRGGVPVSRT
uniref:Uncharacterized protein n=1 Tax=Helianthus annuus TaxID=4232 RepID=A0A251RZ02_HELAN